MADTRSTNAPGDQESESSRIGIGAWIVIAVLISMLIATAVLAYRGWTVGEIEVPASGYIALALGVFFSLVIGVGLMALVFYSSRKGFDRPAELVRDEDDPDRDAPEPRP